MQQGEPTQLEQYQAAIEQRDKELNALRTTLAERNLAVAESDQALARYDEDNVALKQQVAKLNTLNAKLVKFLQQMLESKSWKVTKALRHYKSILANSNEVDADVFLADFLDASQQELAQSQKLLSSLEQQDNFVPLLKAKPLTDKPVKLICFYRSPSLSCLEVRQTKQKQLPGQAEKIENWCPHDKHDFYNVQRQAELAYLYGIEAFCFYCSWQDGECHLEPAMQAYLADGSLKLQFCLCLDGGAYANQVKSYGSKQTPQQGQDGFNTFVGQIPGYLSDSRSLKVGTKPMLIISNPELFPDAKEAVAQLRQWCRQSGMGAIYLVGLATGNSYDPTIYGLDAAIDFTENQTLLGGLAANAEKFSYLLYNIVRPGKLPSDQCNESQQALAATPALHYQAQLLAALSQTNERSNNKHEQYVFIDSWDESMRPQLSDQSNGYTYLEATRMALVRKAILDGRPNTVGNPSLAVVIHAFYEEVFDEILMYLAALQTKPLKLYVTVPITSFRVIETKLRRQQHDFYLLPVSNRGRDILPFLKIMPEVITAGHEFFVKIHTKKSTHREDGDQWRADVFGKLLTETAITTNLKQLRDNPSLGILGPSEHVVPLLQYAGANVDRITQLAARLGVAIEALGHLNFVAGSMFTARTQAIIPLLNIAWNEVDFVAEGKQIDGTLAHALERLFAVSAFSVGLTLSSPNNKVTETYQFVNKEADKSKPG